MASQKLENQHEFNMTLAKNTARAVIELSKKKISGKDICKLVAQNAKKLTRLDDIVTPQSLVFGSSSNVIGGLELTSTTNLQIKMAENVESDDENHDPQTVIEKCDEI